MPTRRRFPQATGYRELRGRTRQCSFGDSSAAGLLSPLVGAHRTITDLPPPREWIPFEVTLRTIGPLVVQVRVWDAHERNR